MKKRPWKKVEEKLAEIAVAAYRQLVKLWLAPGKERMKMGNKSIAQAKDSVSKRTGADNLQGLIKKSNEVGILNISAHGGITEHILKDAIKTAEYVEKYFKEHPEK